MADGGSARPGELTLGGLTIRIVNDTELDDGLTLDGLQPGLLIQVEGGFTADGVVEAEEIELRESDSKVKGSIDVNSVDPSSRRFEVGGVTVQVTPLTILTRDDDGEIDFAQLTAFGTDVEVEGIERGAPDNIYLEALKVEVEDDEDGNDDNGYELEGRLANITPLSITVFGITMSAPSGSYDNGNQDEIIARFVDEVLFVEVEYSGTEPNFNADEIELEEDDDD